MTGGWKTGALACMVLMLGSRASAHVVDEYLQATIVYIEPGGVRLLINLTPGTEVADKVIGQIDCKGDGVITADEMAAYAGRVRRDLMVRLDGRELELNVRACEVPKPEEMRSGWGIIKLELFAAGELAAGDHRVTMVNRHMPGISVYLFNAGFPNSAAVRVLGQKRNLNQSEGEIEFRYEPVGKRSRGGVWPVVVAGLAGLVVMYGMWRKWGVHRD